MTSSSLLRVNTHDVCFDTTPRAQSHRIVECTLMLAATVHGMRVAIHRCVTRIEPVPATRRELIRGSSYRGPHSPMCGHGRLAAIPSTRSASAR